MGSDGSEDALEPASPAVGVSLAGQVDVDARGEASVAVAAGEDGGHDVEPALHADAAEVERARFAAAGAQHLDLGVRGRLAAGEELLDLGQQQPAARRRRARRQREDAAGRAGGLGRAEAVGTGAARGRHPPVARRERHRGPLRVVMLLLVVVVLLLRLLRLFLVELVVVAVVLVLLLAQRLVGWIVQSVRELGGVRQDQVREGAVEIAVLDMVLRPQRRWHCDGICSGSQAGWVTWVLRVGRYWGGGQTGRDGGCAR